jgi:hypothetical protein
VSLSFHGLISTAYADIADQRKECHAALLEQNGKDSAAEWNRRISYISSLHKFYCVMKPETAAR